MAENSKIEWTTHTANLWWGCSKVHAGCDHCYAETLSKRWDFDVWGNDRPRREIKGVFRDLKKFQEMAKKANQIHRVFVGSMMDIFEKPMLLVDAKGEMVTDGIHNYPTYTDALRDQLFEDITDGKYPNLFFLLLTKRPSNINKYIPKAWKENPPANVMFGTSPCDQKTADKLIPQLLKVKGKRFLSVEPMLGPIDVLRFHTNVIEDNLKITTSHIDWIICGGESGPGKRPMELSWARSLRDQCNSIGEPKIPFFMKQIDKVQPIPNDLMIREFPNCFAQ